mgnify:CR=1 FL=1
MKFVIKICILLMIFSIYIPCSAEEVIPGAVSGILIDADSGKIIFEKNKNKKVAMASLTKMMSQIIILEEIEKGNIKWDDIVVVSKTAQDMGGSQIYIEMGERISIRDLMKGISMASGNDATVMMAEVISGTEEKFVERMNKKAKELGLKNTKFVNCTGLDEEGHYSTAYDLSVIARELVINHPSILEFSSLYEDYLREGTDKKFWLVNTNKLVHFYEGADGLKTGHTDNAGYCLAATAKRGDLRLIGIVLGEKDSKIRNSETMSLLDYGFNTVKMNKLMSKDEVVKKISIDKASDKELEIVMCDDLNILENKSSEKVNYRFKYSINEIKLPLKKGEVIGKVKVYNGKYIKSGNLCINKDIKRLSFFDLYLKNIISTFSGNL